MRERRAARGLGQAELARAVAVTRQALHAIETGRHLPNVTTALRLARVLGCAVEELFGPGPEPPVLEAELLGQRTPGPPPVRVKVWAVGGRTFALPLDHLGPALSYVMSADALVVGRAGSGSSRVRLRLLRERSAIAERLVVAGCDPAVQLVGEHLRRHGERAEVVGWPMGSTAALEALKRGEVHVAGVHLLDPRTGEPNVPFLRRRLHGQPLTLVTFASWEAGLLVRRGNPKRIRGVADLARRDVRLVNREAGSGARLLLDERLRRDGIPPERVRGYDELASSHLEVGRKVAEGVADAGVGVLSIARLMGLHFIPLQTERYDLVIPSAHLRSHPGLGRFLDALVSREVRAEIEALGGYDTREAGRVVEWRRRGAGGKGRTSST